MADPLSVFLLCGGAEECDGGFAGCAWLPVGEPVGRFFRIRNGPAVVVEAAAVLCGSVLVWGIFFHAFVDGPVWFDGVGGAGDRRDLSGTVGRVSIGFQPDTGEKGAADAAALEEFEKGFAAASFPSLLASPG